MIEAYTATSRRNKKDRIPSVRSKMSIEEKLLAKEAVDFTTTEAKAPGL